MSSYGASSDSRRRERNDSFKDGARGERRGKIDHDNPPFSRVFVVCSKHHTSDDLKECFEKYGTVEDVWVVKDKHTNENRGVAYIKFSKMSEATLAVQEMDGKEIMADDKPLKVIIAQPKSSKSTEDFDDETALTRLFVSIPRSKDDKDIRSVFDEFGEVDYVQIVKDRKTGESKGFGYVKYKRPYDAAKALEESDRTYRAVMAEPKNKRKIEPEPVDYPPRGQQNFGDLSLNLGFGGIGSRDFMGPSPQSATPEMFMPSNTQASDYRLGGAGYTDFAGSNQGSTGAPVTNRLLVGVSPVVNQDNLGRLFDLIPGMEFCNLKKNYTTGESKGFAHVVYRSVGSAIYAKEKLNGFEYPLGNKITVQYAQEDGDSPANLPIPKASTSDGSDLARAMGVNFNLPPQPLADPDAECVERVFIVCVPQALPDSQMKDIFCRFGNLIDAYMLKGKNFGYAKFTSAESAKRAIELLNGVEVWGVKLKVIQADPPKSTGTESARKRPRT